MSIAHLEILRAILDGKTVQVADAMGRPLPDWAERSGEDALLFVLNNSTRHYYRVRPDTLVRWCPVGASGNVFAHSMDRNTAVVRCRDLNVSKILRLELDADTLDIISARTENP